jgi:hypothetical protein
MGKLLAAGLCTILLASPVIVSAQSAKKDVSKNRLEIIAEKNNYINPSGNYSLKRDPMTFGFESQDHKIQPSGDYEDTYFGKDYSGMLAIISSKQKTALNKAYEATYAQFVQFIANSLTSTLKPGKKMRVEGKILETEFILLDNYPAIRSSVDIHLIDPDVKYSAKEDTPKHTLLLTVIRSETNIYGILMYYNQFTNKDKTNANGAYSEILDNFKILKK